MDIPAATLDPFSNPSIITYLAYNAQGLNMESFKKI